MYKMGEREDILFFRISCKEFNKEKKESVLNLIMCVYIIDVYDMIIIERNRS